MLPNIGTPLKGSGRALNVWKMEWTYTDASGAVSYDATQGDVDQRVATPVADGGAGVTSIRFPKSNRAWVLFCDIEAAAESTAADWREAHVCNINAAAGTCDVRILATDDGAFLDPAASARGRLVLLLEYA